MERTTIRVNGHFGGAENAILWHTIAKKLTYFTYDP